MAEQSIPARPWLLRAGLLARISLLVPASWSVTMGYLAEDTLLAQVIATGGKSALSIQFAMLVAVLIAWADVLVNDLLPDRFVLRWACERRHLIFSVLATTYFVQAFAAASSVVNDAQLLAGRFVSIGLICAWYSWAAAQRTES